MKKANRRFSGAVTSFFVAATSCTGLLHPRHPYDAPCPDASREVIVGGVHYCVLTCPGVQQNDVYCGAGLYGIGDYDGARVCAVQEHDANGIVLPQREGPPPNEVCRLLPQGCRCSPSNWACQRFEPGALLPVGFHGGRCEPTDPECGPVAFNHDCLDHAGYDRQARRITPGDDRRRGPPECTYDGECVDSGCGYACLSIHERRDVVFTCEGRPDIEKALEDHFCGCVNGSCRWFEQ